MNTNEIIYCSTYRKNIKRENEGGGGDNTHE